MKKLITLALCALPYVAFASDTTSPVPKPIVIKKQTVSALPKELYDGWWVTYDRMTHFSYALRYSLKGGEVHGEHHTYNCSDSTLTPERTTFKLVPTAKKGFDLRYTDSPEFRSYMTFSAMLPKAFVMAKQSFAEGDELALELFPEGVNWIYLYSETSAPKCPNI